jgi:hypothetical protein
MLSFVPPLQVFDVAARLVSTGQDAVLLTAIYIGQELRGVLSDARFVRVYEHGTLSGSDVIAELFFMTSRKEKGIVCTPVGNAILERRLLAILPPDADKVNLAEGLWLAIFFLLLGAWVLNTSPTGLQAQHLLKESWKGTVALAEQLGTKTLEERGMQWASSAPPEADTSAFMRRALNMTHRLLRAGLWVDEHGNSVLPQIPANATHPASFSWLQCFNSLIGHRATRKARFALWAMSCSDPECRLQLKSPICVHALYAIHRHIVLKREPCVRCSDHEMYFAPPAVSDDEPVLASSEIAVPTEAATAVALAPLSDADRLLQCAASVSSLALQLPSYLHGVVPVSQGSRSQWLTHQERQELDSACKTLHRLAMKREISMRASDTATSFAGAHTSRHRLQTQSDIVRTQRSARGVQSGDPGPLGLLRRQLMLLPDINDSNPTLGDFDMVAQAAREAGERLSTFIAQFDAPALFEAGAVQLESANLAAQATMTTHGTHDEGDGSTILPGQSQVPSNVGRLRMPRHPGPTVALHDTPTNSAAADDDDDDDNEASLSGGMTQTSAATAGLSRFRVNRATPALNADASLHRHGTGGAQAASGAGGSAAVSTRHERDMRGSKRGYNAAHAPGASSLLGSSAGPPSADSELGGSSDDDNYDGTGMDFDSNRRKRVREESAMEPSVVTLDVQLRHQKYAWCRLTHGTGQLAWEAPQGSGISMAQHCSGKVFCNVCDDGATCFWREPEDADRYHSMHFMECVVCSNIVCGLGIK